MVLDVEPGSLYLERIAGIKRSRENTKKGCHDDGKELCGSLGIGQVECLKMWTVHLDCLDLNTDSILSVYIVALLTIVPNWKQPKYPSIGEWMVQMYKVLVHSHNGILFSIKSDKLINITRMNFKHFVLIEGNQTKN